MGITPYTVLMSVLYFNIFVLLVCIFKKTTLFFNNYNIFYLLVVLFVAIFRLVFSIEFPFTKVIPSFVILPTLIQSLRLPIFTISTFTITLATLLLTIWGIGVIVQLINNITSYINYIHVLKNLKANLDDDVMQVSQKLLREKNIKYLPNIVQCNSIVTPQVSGFLTPTIYLPKISELTKHEWECIIKHELEHYIHGDIWIKLIVLILCSIYWWNPITYILWYNLDHFLEIYCDYNVTKHMNDDEKYKYLSTILKIMAFSKSEKKQKSFLLNSGLTNQKGMKIKQRFSIILNSNISKVKSRFIVSTFTFATIAITILSFSFIIQPRIIPKVEEFNDSGNDGFLIEASNAHIEKRGDKYTLHFNNNVVTQISEEEVQYLINSENLKLIDYSTE